VGRNDAILKSGQATLTVCVVLADRLDVVIYAPTEKFVSVNLVMTRKMWCAWSFVYLDPTVTGLSHDSDTVNSFHSVLYSRF